MRVCHLHIHAIEFAISDDATIVTPTVGHS